VVAVRTYPGAEVRRWLAGVGAIAAAVNAVTPLPELLDLIARTACALTDYEASAVLLVDPERRSLRISGSEGLSAAYVAQVNERHTIVLGSGPLAAGPSTRAFLTARPVPIPDILADASFAPWADLAHDHGYRAIAAVPLLVGDEPVGTLNCYRRAVHEFGPDELALLATLANQAGTALQSARLITSLTEQRRLLEQAEEIHRELTAVALRAGGVQGVADALARLLGRPVLVTDRDGAAAATATHRGVQLAPEPVDGDLPVAGLGESAALGRVTAPVLLGREVVARLWLTGRLAELGELDRRAVEHAALVCALEYLRRRTAADVECCCPTCCPAPRRGRRRPAPRRWATTSPARTRRWSRPSTDPRTRGRAGPCSGSCRPWPTGATPGRWSPGPASTSSCCGRTGSAGTARPPPPTPSAPGPGPRWAGRRRRSSSGRPATGSRTSARPSPRRAARSSSPASTARTGR
jgi:GAF domain-containing protein